MAIYMHSNDWRPWDNTVAYYPLESNGNDYSGNNHNLTWTWTPSYTTSWWTKNVLSLNGSTLGKISSLSWTYGNYTINLWIKHNNTNTWQQFFWNMNSSWWNTVYFNFNGTSQDASKIDYWYQRRPWWWSTSYATLYWTTNRSANTWYNVCITATPSSVILYVNWNQVASTSTNGTVILDSWGNAIWWRWNWMSNRNENFVNWYMSEFILENKTWTAAQISDYYNSTKSKYWL